MAILQLFLNSLSGSVDTARAWFMAEKSAKSRDDYFAKGKLGDPW